MQPERFRVIIADDHEFTRAGLRAMLEGEPDVVIIGEATGGRQAVELCAATGADLAVLDIRMPELDGIAATRAIRERCPATRVLIVTMHESPEYLQEALRAGATGYVLKDASRRTFLAAVRQVLHGETFVSGSLALQLLQRGAPPGAEQRGGPAGERLTPREHEVLQLIALGHTNRAIGRELAVSVSTVKVHVERIIAKLGVADRTQAAVRAVELGLIAKRPATER